MFLFWYRLPNVSCTIQSMISWKGMCSLFCITCFQSWLSSIDSIVLWGTEQHNRVCILLGCAIQFSFLYAFKTPNILNTVEKLQKICHFIACLILEWTSTGYVLVNFSAYFQSFQSQTKRRGAGGEGRNPNNTNIQMKAELKDRRVKKQDGEVRCNKLGQHDRQGGN